MTLETVFLKVLNMSVTAGYVILAVLLLRLLLSRLPFVRLQRKYICLLWGIVLLRLLVPFSPESAVSLLPGREPVPMDIAMMRQPKIDSGIGLVDAALNPVIARNFTPNPAVSANPLQIWIPLAGLVWCAGMTLLLLYTLASLFRLKRITATAVPESEAEQIFRCDGIPSPFVAGIIWPRIYLPFTLQEPELSYVLRHERMHLHRRDYWWKPLFYLAAVIHWFNPLVWLACYFMGRDLEMACDEAVLGELGSERKTDYCQALLQVASEHRFALGGPLAFGENGVKARIRNLLRYKKPYAWAGGIALALLLVAAAVFLTSPEEKETAGQNEAEGTQTAVQSGTEEMQTAGQNETEKPQTAGQSETEGLQTAEQSEAIELQAAEEAEAKEVLRRFSAIPASELRERSVNIAQNANGWEESNVIYLAELPEYGITMYGYNDEDYTRGVAIEAAGDVNYFAWYYLTPRLIMPRMYWNEDRQELQVSLYVGSGTGFSVEELHVLPKYAKGLLDDFGFGSDEYVPLLEERLGYSYDEASGVLTLYDEAAPGTPLAQVKPELQEGEKLIGIAGLGDITEFQLGEEIRLRFAVGYLLEGIAPVLYEGMPDLEAPVEITRTTGANGHSILTFDLGEIRVAMD